MVSMFTGSKLSFTLFDSYSPSKIQCTGPCTAMHGHSVRSESSSSTISSIVPLKANPHIYSHQSELHESFELLECSTYLLALNYVLSFNILEVKSSENFLQFSIGTMLHSFMYTQVLDSLIDSHMATGCFHAFENSLFILCPLHFFVYSGQRI